MIDTNYIKMSHNCKRVLFILKDGKLHLNSDMWNVLSGGFALAARIHDLRNYTDEDGKRIYKIESGNPEHFNKVRQSRGDWYYQLQPIMRPGQRQQSLYPTGLIAKTILEGIIGA